MPITPVFRMTTTKAAARPPGLLYPARTCWSRPLVRRNVGTPTSMRGPGAVPGLYALESAIDELALKLKMDPVQLRLLNEPKVDESNGKPFSSRHLQECLTVGAEKFGWHKRNPAIGSMKSAWDRCWAGASLRAPGER